MGLLKAVLIILLIYYLFKILFRIFAPKLFGYALKKTEARFREQFGEFSNDGSTSNETDQRTIFSKKKGQKSNPDKNVGEYIDFEEVD
ncbi:MAG: DUF4834 family protein [Flavobacteriaceae bacterium]